MSLQIWLPLNGNVENQGLAKVATSGGTVYANGKIGQCIGVKSSTKVVITHTMATTTNFSMAFWMKIPANMASGTVWENLLSFTGISASGGSAGTCSMTWANYDAVKIWDTANQQWLWAYAGRNFQYDTWTHWCITHAASGEGVQGKIYIDGILKGTYANSTHPLQITAGRIELGRSVNTDTVYYNDFRVYDHTLSEKEVHELAKGLVLHYKLDDGYVEGTTNLVTTADGLSNTCYNGATNKYSYGTNTDMYKTVTTFEGRNGTKVYMGTDGLDAYPYVYFDAFSPVGESIKTLSFDYYPTIQNTLVPYSYNGAYNWECFVNGTKFEATNSGQRVLTGVKVHQWNHIEITARKYDTTNTARGTGYVRIGSAKHTSDTSNFWFFANVQVEEKDHATPYVGGPGLTRTPDTVFDSSGFKYNGTPTSIAISKDAARYSNSFAFNGSSSYIKTESKDWMVSGSTELTINFWAKTSNWTSGRMISCTESGGFNIEPGNSGYLRFPVNAYTNADKTSRTYIYDSSELQISAMPVNQWVMLTCVYDASVGTKTYINGVFHHAYSRVTYGIYYNPNARFFIGCEARTASPSSPYFNGSISDFRMYSTALSAEDILELYQTSASIDKNGNVYARELVEE